MKLASQPPSTSRTALVCVVALGVAWLALTGLAWFREWAYPWSDGSGHYVGLQIDNECSLPVALGYRRALDAEWRWVNGTRVDYRTSQWCVGTSPIEVVEPVVTAQPLALRLECGPRTWSAPLELSLDVDPQSFVRVRISEEGQVLVAQGTESFVGYPRYGSERIVGVVTP